MNKKIISVLLSLCITFSLIQVTAQTEAVVSFLKGEIFADAGESIELTLDLSGCDGFTDLGLQIGYDRGVMKLIDVQTNPSVGLTCTTAQYLETNPYNIGWSGMQNTYFNGNLATFIFRILPDAEEGVYDVSVDYYKGINGNYVDGLNVNYDENDNPLNLTYEPCRIFVEGNNNTPSGGGSMGGGGGTGERTTVALSKAEGYAGENVDVTLDLSNNTGFANLGFEIVYESSSLTLLKVNNNVSGVTFTTAESIGENPFNAGWDSVSDIEYNGNLATFTFKINEETPAGAYPVTLSYYKGRNGNYVDGVSVNYDENDNPLDLLYANGCITVLEKQVEEPDETVYRVEFVSEKKEYAIGEPFEVDVWLYTDDYAIRIYENEYKVSGFDSSQAGIYNVIVSYGGYSQEFEIQVIEDKEIEIIQTFVVQSVASEGAYVSPSGYSQVKEGTVMNFTVGAVGGYEIEKVTVNGESAEITDGNISITVNENTVVETFAQKKKYSVKATANGNGNIELSADFVEHGNNCTAKIVAEEGYIVSDVIVDGQSVGVCKAYTFTGVKENHTIEAFFEKAIKTVTVKAAAGKGGKVYPAKSTVNSGASAKFTVTPDYGYYVDYILVDGVKKQTASNEIIVENVTKDTDISVVFSKKQFSVTANNSEGVNISVKYEGETAQTLNVPYMENANIFIDVEEGYKLNNLYVNNTPVKANKADGRLVYNFAVTEDTVISARCSVTVEYEFSQKVAQAGLAADINIVNAHDKKEIFTQLADEYSVLSTAQQRACTSAYATVLAALDRANAYIAIADSNIIARISALPNEITSADYRNYKPGIDSIYSEYEKMTYLSKSLIDYGYISKLTELKKKTEQFDKESKGIIAYLYELINSVPDADNYDMSGLSEAYSKLMLAEDTYYSMSQQDKGDVSEIKYEELINKHAKISAHIQRLYVTPFTSRVLRCSPVTAQDTFADAESKRVAIYNLMNEYHSFPLFVQEQIFASTVQKLNSLYESASIKVTATVNNLPVDMNGDFDEETELVLTEPELDNNAVTDATGKSVYQAIDVKMYSNQQEIQPSSKIRIKMEISRELSDADVSVVYINDEEMVYDVQGEVIEEDGKYFIVFFIDHFSSFAVLYNQSVAEETKISFESDCAEVGDIVTVNATGTVNTANCIMLITGYSETGETTFVKTGASATVEENTHIVKAMLWNKAMMPLTEDISLTVTE